MGPGEGGDDFGQGGQVEVDQRPDGMVVVEDVLAPGEGAEAGRAVAELRGRLERPTSRPVPPDLGPLGPSQVSRSR